MIQRMSVSEAQERLPSIVESIASGGDAVEIEDKGRVVATITAVEADERRPEPMQGGLALLKLRELYGNPTDQEVDAFLSDVYDERSRDMGRVVELRD